MNERNKKLWKSKKGFNDLVILAGITSILLISAFVIPLTQDAFGQPQTTFDSDNLKDNLQNEAESVNSISAFGILTTFLKLIFWDVSGSLALPAWLQVFYTIIFIVAVLTVARNLWIGGGS